MRTSFTEQLADFFGWKNGSMCQENISSSKPAILGMSSRLGGSEALSQDPMLEMEVEMETDPLDIKSLRQEMEEYIVLEEDPEMYAMARIELVPVPAAVPVQKDRDTNQAGHGFFAIAPTLLAAFPATIGDCKVPNLQYIYR